VSYPGTAQICWVPPYYLRNGESYELQIWPEHLQGPSEQNPIKYFGEKKRVRIKFVKYPILSQERVKLRTSNFVRTFLCSIGRKAR